MSAPSGNLTRSSVNLTPRAVAARDAAREKTGDSNTDVINNALRAYALLLELADASGRLLVQRPDGTVERVCLP